LREVLRRTAVLACAVAAAFGIGIAAKLLLGSRFAGAVAFIVVLLAFTPFVWRSAGRRPVPRRRIMRLSWLTAGTIVVVAVSVVFVPAPFGGAVALLVSAPAYLQWLGATRPEAE
jgi:Mn2+/Fe2+ NRAMP family transporter